MRSIFVCNRIVIKHIHCFGPFDWQAGKAVRKAKLKNVMKAKMRAHLRRHKEQQSKKAEAPPAGDETPLAAGAGDETPVPPASPEPVPEASEAALWPEAGVKVAVGVEHLQHSLRFGETWGQ